MEKEGWPEASRIEGGNGRGQHHALSYVSNHVATDRKPPLGNENKTTSAVLACGRDGERHHTDAEVILIGSANMDRRSFDLNYENNILLHDRVTTINMRARQFEYVANSDAVSFDDVYSWNWRQRILNNSMAILGPVL